MRDLNVIAADGERPATPGTDHGWFSWSPIVDRPHVALPGGERVAVCVVVDVGAVEWDRSGAAVPAPPGGRGVAPPPDFPRMSHREFGHRVGIFRLVDVLASAGIAPAFALDVLSAERYPGLLEHLAGHEVIAHGLSASRPITSAMTPDEEAHYIATTLSRLEAATGRRPSGWLSPEHSESANTPGLLDAAGVGYVADWGNDEQPYPMTGAGDLWALPISWELTDVEAVFHRDVPPTVYARSLVEAFDELAAGAGGGRIMVVHLHPWLSGQAFRADALEHALKHIASSEAAWLTTPGDVVDWWRLTTLERVRPAP